MTNFCLKLRDKAIDREKKGGLNKEAALVKLRNSSHRCSEPFGSQKCYTQAQ
ncbi:hypothetical protein AMC99_02503 [Altererythrobacter epoxidivorans]|uniref:Uncharacterized protein n=1 Tax=Altererythrobacter epoxidivorans TaxID=361183 RepID=A0A0M3TB32_9SPHN|nr:hypothetical protein AMC99_02503 [Altererythrobacter epoxidivorans]